LLNFNTLVEPLPEVGVRLVGGSSAESGRVEVFNDGEWGTICDNIWDPADGAVVCRELGYSELYSNDGIAEYGQGEGPILAGVICTGNEAKLKDCGWGLWDTLACTHSEDVGITCQTGTSRFAF
jgi:hypothetical protein